MSSYLDLPVSEIHNLLVLKKIKPIDLVEEAFFRIADNKLNAFITIDYTGARKRALELENNIEVDNLLWGLPIAIKDNIMVSNLKCTCASRMLENFISVYDASVITLIKQAGMIIIGKTNMDEFAMGSTSETSYFKAPLNPWNLKKVAGGSSGGSAVSVASNITPFALGSDTGGSIRQPASFTGIVGMKPTYGRVSRFGLVAFASSLDQIGPMTRNVYENALLLNLISQKDEKDLTSIQTNEDFTRLIGKDIKNMKIAIPNYFVSDVVSKSVLTKFQDIVNILKNKGCQIDYVDINHLDKAVILYQIIAMGEASSNLARFDGIRYGLNIKANSLDMMYKKTRSEGFGVEVKRRIMIGSYILSGQNAKIYYDKALQLRNYLKQSFLKLYQDYDLIISPTSSRVAYDLNLNSDDPLKCFQDDLLVMHANMGGFPSMSIPMGFIDNLPIGLQIMGNLYDEAKMYQLASYLEKELNLDLNGGSYVQ